MHARSTLSLMLAAAAFATTAMADPPAGPQTGQWNNITADKNSQSRNNCYNYALNARNGRFAQPGRKAEEPWKYPSGVPFWSWHVAATKADSMIYKGRAADLRDFGNAVKAAARADGLTPRARLADVPAGHSAVALVVGYVPIGQPVRLPNGSWATYHVLDYHWFRLNADGTWSHKPGKGKATAKDDAGNAIANPEALITANETKSRYDRFVGYFSFVAGTIDPESIDNWLVQTPEGTIRIIAGGSSGLKAGWCEGDRVSIRSLVQDYLTGLPTAPQPSNAWHGKTDGFIIEAGPRCLTQNPSLWDRSDEVQITVRGGVIQVLRHTTTGQLITTYHQDVYGLGEYLAGQALARITTDPCGGACYADCDQTTGVGVLDIFDFLCFGNKFATGDPYACDCDQTTGAGVCDIFDFLCFGNAFNSGCN